MKLKQKIAQYQPTDEVKQLVLSSNLVLVAGIVSAGKDTVVSHLLKNEQFMPIISHTTRAPRQNHGVMEQNGVDYHFIDIGKAERMVDDGAFVEAKYVHDNVYGTSFAELDTIKRARKYAVTDIDIHGVDEYLSIKPDAKAIFLLPPSVQTWLQRLEKRYGELDVSSEDIQKRFTTAKKEIEHIMQDDRFVIIINDDLETTLNRINLVVEGDKDHTSDFAEAVAEHLLEYIDSVI